MNTLATITDELHKTFGSAIVATPPARDGIPTLWIARERICDILRHLKLGVDSPYRMLYDLTAIDERMRVHRAGQPAGDFTVVYHLLSFDRNEYIRLKVALTHDDLHIPTITGIWPAANWYEREIWDMFGIVVDGHPHLTRILMPQTWQGHPLRKNHPARATEMGPFELPPEKEDREQEALRFRPEEWG
ncbi:MAG: NADH-quinone oxidoreductase subunit C, partial [Candidatus Acidiferrum sp.]